MPTSKEAEIYAALLQAFGWTVAEATARLEALKTKHGWAEVPVEVLIGLLLAEASPDTLVRALQGIAPNLAAFLNTGKSTITRDNAASA